MLPRQPKATRIKHTQTCLRLPVTLYEQIRTESDLAQCSQTALIIDALNYYFEQGKLDK
jgi:hypothetical protein